MIAEIPRYWESRIDKMMSVVPEAMLQGGIELYMHREIYEMMKGPKEYNGMKVSPGPGIPEDYMMITERKNLFWDGHLDY